MNLKRYSSAIFLLMFLTFSMCASKKETKIEEDSKDSTEVSESKLQIKAFWESYRKAQKYRVDGHWNEAVLAYEKALQINPVHEDSWFNLGNMYLELNQGKKAEACWLIIANQNPNSARAHMQLGRLYLAIDRKETFDLKKAEFEFKAAASINKVITGPLMQLGYVALLKGENEEARQYFQSVIGTDTKSVEPHFLLGFLNWKNGNTTKMQIHINNAYALAFANKTTKKDLSEGDTKNGTSHLRPINQSLFHEFSMNLEEIKEETLLPESLERFHNLDLYLTEIKKQIAN